MSNKYIFIYILLQLVSTCLIAQKETFHWYFGDKAGIDFSSGYPVSDTNGNVYALEGVSSISDYNGNLLFYTNGINVYNKNHIIMEGGDWLMGNQSSTQSSIIVKQPENDSIYYIFTLDAYNSYYLVPPHKGFRYNIVNINDNNGSGKVIYKNILLDSNISEQVAAIKHCNGIDIWIVVSIRNSNTYHAYLMTKNGLSTTPVVSESGVGISYNVWTAGYMKASPNGKKIVSAHNINLPASTNIEILDFNNQTGKLSNAIPIGCSYTSNLSAYGVEFSPNQKYLYVSYLAQVTNSNNYIIQYDISSNIDSIIGQSAYTVYWSNVPLFHPNSHTSAALQRGPDKKIYVAFAEYSHIGVINFPDSVGTACSFIQNGVYLKGRKSQYGLPTFSQQYFDIDNEITYTQRCLNLNFTPICDSADLDSVIWDFGDINSGINNTSNTYKPQHSFSDTGSYVIKTVFYHPCNNFDTVIKNINIHYPPESFIKDTVTDICKQIQFYSDCDYSTIDSLKWDFGDLSSGIENTSTSYNPAHNFNDTGTYHISLIIFGFCKTDTITKSIHINFPVLNFSLGNDSILCFNDTLFLGSNIISNVIASYNWQNGDSTSTFLVKQPGLYWLKINAGGCWFVDSIDIKYISPPYIQLPEDKVICEGQSITLSIPLETYSLIWDNGLTEHKRIINESGLYTVTAKNKCGVSTDDFLLITKNCDCDLYIPNAFTPSNDGLNDCYAAKHYCDFTYFRFSIFNRWGELIFETNNPTECWDGKYLGNNAKSDIYVWLIQYKGLEFNEIKTKKGTLTLIR